MESCHRSRCSLAALAASLVVTGCTITPDLSPPNADGTFSGTTEHGKPLVLELAEDGIHFTGRGLLDGMPFVISGSQTWRGAGTVTRDDGSFSPLTVELSADYQMMILDVLGESEVVLNRGGQLEPTSPGPFSGQYRSSDFEPFILDIILMQDGELIAGMALGAGDPASVTGRVTDMGKMTGVLTFMDGSQISIDAELSADNQVLTIRGLGAPLNFTRG